MPRFRIRRRWIWIGLTLLLFTVLFNVWQSAIKKNRQKPVGPFQIAGNLYYVGTANVTSFLLTGPEGHVLIDGSYPEAAPTIIESISKLGYNISDVRILLNSHAHADHAGGLAELKAASGAELWISRADSDVIEAGGRGDPALAPLKFLQWLGVGTFPPAKVDRRFADGDTVRVGPIELTAHVTAGHTPGCTSWSFPVWDGERELLAVSIGSLTILPFMSLVEPETYPGIRQDFESSFRTLRSLPADLFLASHGNWFNLNRKMRERAHAAKPVDPFVDPKGYLDFIAEAERRFRETLAEQVTKPASSSP